MNENFDHLRHSCAHLLAGAVMDLYPRALLTLGPSIEDGFYYDIDFGDTKISESDFPAIEAQMHKLAPTWDSFVEQKISLSEAKKVFKDNPYKLELIKEISDRGEAITLYKSGNFSDLCRGGHIDLITQSLNHFKLLSVAGAYWRGSEKNKMLTRIYGTCFPSQKELDEYLNRIEQAKLHDHRKIGQDLKLFVFSDLIGKGLPIFSPNGATIKRELERFTIDEELKRGYHHVITPDLAKVDLYKKSGHYPYYKDTMYPIMKIDEDELILKPMTCPHHFMFYKSEHHSYRDLPYRIGEIAHQYRYEKSGELSGLTRVRMFCLADAHIISAKSQSKQVIKEVLELIDFINGTLGMVKGTDYRYRLSLGDRADTKKYYKDDAAWEYAENILREVLIELNAPYFEASNEAAFYGPKIDIQVKKADGKEETAFTVQYDFVMPERFDLTFTNKEGQDERPVVIHRSSIGCLERTIAFLIEKYAGAFPTWLAPVQATILPISDKHAEYAHKVHQTLKEANIRVDLDDRNEPLNARVRDAEMQKIPYILVLGDREAQSDTVSIRRRGQKASTTQSLTDFTSDIATVIASRLNN
jgi:threonyl-tRNA synthetase